MHVGVDAAGRDQVVVRAALGDAALVEHENLVRVTDRRDAVRDDEARARLADAPQLLKDRLFGRGIDGRKRVVEHENARIDRERARDRDALLLAARERDAALADDRVEAVAEALDVRREARGLGRVR